MTCATTPLEFVKQRPVLILEISLAGGLVRERLLTGKGIKKETHSTGCPRKT